MRHFYLLLIFLLPFVPLTIIDTAYGQTMHPYNCPGLHGTPKQRTAHVDLLEHAELAHFAYTEILGWQTLDRSKVCPMGFLRQPPIFSIDVGAIPSKVLKKATDVIRKRNDSWAIDTYSDPKTDDKYVSVTCTTKQTFRERLAVAFRYVRSNDNLSLLAKAAIVGISGLTRTESIGIVELKNSQEETVLGLQGTNLLDIDKWNTSIQNLIETWKNGNSCVFDFAVEVSTAFFGRGSADGFHEYQSKRYGIVGHSLGGAVAQHVAQSVDIETKLRKHQEVAIFRAYSFNSIGVDARAGSAKPKNTIVSVWVAGEILEAMQEKVGRRQTGYLFRYGASSTRLPLWKRIQRHKIQSVKKEICSCLEDGNREFEFSR